MRRRKDCRPSQQLGSTVSFDSNEKLKYMCNLARTSSTSGKQIITIRRLQEALPRLMNFESSLPSVGSSRLAAAAARTPQTLASSVQIRWVSGNRMASASAFQIRVLRYIRRVSQPPLRQDSLSVHRKGWASVRHDASTCGLALPSPIPPVCDLECARRRVCDLRRVRPGSATRASVAL